MARYEQGETLSSIARTYDCSPPAISYIVSRSRGKAASETPPPTAAEALLVKTAAEDAEGNGSVAVEPTVVPAAPALIRREAAPEPKPIAAAGNGADSPSEQRRTLHLSLGNGTANGNGSPNGSGAHTNGNGHASRPAQAEASPNGNGQRPFQALRNPPASDAGRNGESLFALPEGRPTAQQPRDGADSARKDNATFIGQELRSRVDGDIAAFLAAFDAALAADTQESRFGLREATDRLLRAGARTRIELERLEARIPLSRDGGAEPQPAAWRYR